MALPRQLTAKIYDIKAHNGNVTALDLGETGRVLVTGGQDRFVNLWAIGQQECSMSLTGHNDAIECVRFVNNDDFVYSADSIGVIRLWDLIAQTMCGTLNGHMKSVRTLDFNPRSWEILVSGSNDTTVRIWDVRNQNKFMKAYRGHIAQVNSVKFSPDGKWIASAGSEGAVLIWDIRGSKKIMEFTEAPPAVAITCIQFHPCEFLLAVGTAKGVVCIYDLEKQVRIACTNQFPGHAIKCLHFNETANCLFVGSAAGISVIGWEPDDEFDHIASTWTNLADMKEINKKLFMCAFDKECVSINALTINRVFPFYNPSNQTKPNRFIYNSSTRKSFTKGNQKLRLSLTANSSSSNGKPSRLVEENEDGIKSNSLDGQSSSSPNLSLELVDETLENNHSVVNNLPAVMPPSFAFNTNSSVYRSYADEIQQQQQQQQQLLPQQQSIYNLSPKNLVPPPYNFNSMVSSTGLSPLISNSMTGSYAGPSSLQLTTPERADDFAYYESFATPNDTLNDSNPPIIYNYDHTEMVEDFPVNQNVHQMNGVSNATSLKTNAASAAAAQQAGKIASNKARSNMTTAKRGGTQLTISSAVSKTSSTSYQQRNSRLAQMTSVSSSDLHKLDDNMLLKKSASSHLVINKTSKRMANSQSQLNKENARNKNIPVTILTKGPTRSKTSVDLRSPQQQNAASPRQSHIPISYRADPTLFSSSALNQQRIMHHPHTINIDDESEIQMLIASHEQIYQELINRQATLQLIKNSMKNCNDIVSALRQAIKMRNRTVFVDLLGAIIEKTSSWNLDLCTILLPELYELLQSQHKFHFTRACDTLRVIISTFLPIIQENIDPWAACSLGVDVSREERQRKCQECQRWLLQIRNLPDDNHFGATLTQLQKLIVNI